ncbi:MAG: aldehyde dehydrogenase family protein [Bacteroidota bacterium]
MILSELIKRNSERKYYSFFAENPKSYDENLQAQGLAAFQNRLNTNYSFAGDSAIEYSGEEVSPYMQTGIGVKYANYPVDTLISNSLSAFNSWRSIPLQQRADILINSLNNVKERFFELAYATMHTTGQSFLMSFQASGPHACDRALEVIAMAFEQLSYFPAEVDWTKNMGKFDLTLHKTFKPIPRGISLAIGCSTFPTWNTVPGVYASLITGNSVIIKPHPKAVYPIAIFIDELRNEFVKNNLPADIIQLAIDSSAKPITKQLAEHPDVKMIDYTGGNMMGDYVEGLNKICFTEKSGINSVILESVKNIDAVAQNIAFSASLYSGQMCTAPQNIYIPKEGITTENGPLSFEETKTKIVEAVNGLLTNPKAAAPTLGAIQNDATIKRIEDIKQQFADKLSLSDLKVDNTEFADARIKSVNILTVDSNEKEIYLKEYFGPLICIVKTESKDESVKLAKASAEANGAITCLAFAVEPERMAIIENEMNAAFTPVSFNFTGAAFVNQHAAFSDLHVSGGNPSGNASFTNSEFINKRYIWIGNRYLL